MPMKFRAHDTFFIRKGWLSKGMRCVHNKPDLFVDKEEIPMDEENEIEEAPVEEE